MKEKRTGLPKVEDLKFDDFCPCNPEFFQTTGRRWGGYNFEIMCTNCGHRFAHVNHLRKIVDDLEGKDIEAEEAKVFEQLRQEFGSAQKKK
jgi:hypothetical protein